ncbi:MAG: lysozyme [Saprospiraceae bacterium]|jgi:lysozyme
MKYITAILIASLILSCNTVTERMPYYEVHGIDVSHYQSIVNWDTIAVQKIDFVFVKATEGEEIADSLFRDNWMNINRVGLKRGAYHFFRPKGSAYKQAQNFIDNVRLEEGDLPPVLDVEVADGISAEEIVKSIRAWIEIIENHYQIKPIIYTNLNFYDGYIDQNFDGYPIWIARYNTQKPYLGNKRDWHFWQYGNKGQLPGIDGFVDFNVFKGTLLDLESICLSYDPVYSSK